MLGIKIIDLEGKENGVNSVFLVGKQGILGGKGLSCLRLYLLGNEIPPELVSFPW
jgi:hypothetical protein